MSARSVKIALVQMSMSADKAANLAKAAERVREAASRGAELVCLPELFATPYFCQSEDASNFDLAEPMNGPTTEAMAKAAREAKVAVVVPFFERRAAGIYHNSLVVVGPSGAIAGSYRKMHIPDDPLFYEKYYFTPGDLGFGTIESGPIAVGPLICWDQWYPEAARAMVLKGAEILLYPTAIGSEPYDLSLDTHARWQRAMQGHAVSNAVPVIAANRIGVEQNDGATQSYYGHSFIADHAGELVANFGDAEEGVVVHSFDLAEIERYRAEWGFFRDRRTDLYAKSIL